MLLLAFFLPLVNSWVVTVTLDLDPVPLALNQEKGIVLVSTITDQLTMSSFCVFIFNATLLSSLHL